MNDYKEISPYELSLPVCSAIGRDWMLICAGNGRQVNAMTASWGFLGELWGGPAAACFVRPSRYTFPLTDGGEFFSLCFFGGERKRELSYFGTHSGRDGDKAAACGMRYASVFVWDVSVPYVDRASTVLVCRKLYADDIKPDGFCCDGFGSDGCADSEIVKKYYSAGDVHRMFIGKIEKCLVRAGSARAHSRV